jgi:uncharacterized damage-inducible protein DinB
MQIIEMFLKELDNEAQTTRKFLKLVPNDKFDWQPHPKSMTMLRLATHIAELPEWVTLAVTTDELDFAKNPPKQEVINNNEELLAYFEKNFAEGCERLWASHEALLAENWTLRNGDAIYLTSTKAELIRVTLNQTTHHRAQLGVYLRLLNIPIPGSYGPSADELEFAAMEQD